MQWRDIPGYEAIYRISEFGDVLSCERLVHSARHKSGYKRVKARMMRPYLREGYQTVDLTVGKVTKKGRVHHLVALAFIGPWPEWAECVRHLNDERSENHYSNLAYGTQAQNVSDSIRLGTFTHGENNGTARFTNREVAEIKRRLLDGMGARLLADEYGVYVQTVYAIKAGRNWAHIAPATWGS